ncbi:MAG: YeiH family protein [Anaerolineae bacterium]
MTTIARRPPSAWESAIFGVSLAEVPGLLPGVAVATVASWLGTVLAGFLGTQVLGFRQSPISPIMVAILIGMVGANVVPLPALLQPGIRFCVRKVLRLGIVLLGIRLSLTDVLQIGAYGVPMVAICIATGLLLTSAFTHWLRLPERLGTLIAVGTGICGLSAIVATAPAIEANDEEVAYAAANITIFGALATFLYPYLAHALFAGDPVRAGLFLGTSVHDTSQVTAAALIFDQVYRLAGRASATDVAVVTKMVRNVFMAAVVPLMAYVYARRQAQGSGRKVSVRSLLPLFVVGFLAVALLRTIGDAMVQRGVAALGIWDGTGWQAFTTATKAAAENLLILALAGVGLSTRFSFLCKLGAKPFLVGLVSATLVGVVGAICAYVVGPLIAF